MGKIASVPSTIRRLFRAAGLSPDGVVRWGEPIPEPAEEQPDTGVYAVAVTDAPDSLDAAVAECPISRDRVRDLLVTRPELRLDGERPKPEALIARLKAFWYPDEVVVYVGRAGPRQHIRVSALSDRVAEYYATPLGARSPHAGGWPVKLLESLEDLFVHYAYCSGIVERELLVLDAFSQGISEASKALLYDQDRPIPFANLTGGSGRKTHGISGGEGATKTGHPGALRRSERFNRAGHYRSAKRTSHAESHCWRHQAGHHSDSPGNQGTLPSECRTC